jgi:hypothetical protein
MAKRTSIEQIVEDSANCPNALATLETAGCNRLEVLSRLDLCRMKLAAEEDWKTLTEMGKREIAAIGKNLNSVAQVLERFNKSKAGWLLGVQGGNQCLRAAPLAMRMCKEVLTDFCKTAGPKKRPFMNEARASLVAYVMKRTRNWHDPEVSELLNAVYRAQGRKTDYTVENHKVWRNRSKSLVAKFLDPMKPPLASPPRSET